MYLLLHLCHRHCPSLALKPPHHSSKRDVAPQRLASRLGLWRCTDNINNKPFIMGGKLIVTLRIVARACRLSADASIEPFCPFCRHAGTETEWGPRDYRVWWKGPAWVATTQIKSKVTHLHLTGNCLHHLAPRGPLVAPRQLCFSALHAVTCRWCGLDRSSCCVLGLIEFQVVHEGQNSH